MLQVLVIDESRSRAGEICAGLALAGCQVAAILAASDDLAREVENLQPDLVLIATDGPGRETLENLAAMQRRRPRPVVMFARQGEDDAIRAAIGAGVSAYVVDGLDPGRFKGVIDVARAHFDQYQTLRRELEQLSQKLSERKLVERAKGLLMKTRQLDEDGAYHALRKLAMQRGQPMAAVARDVLDMASLFL